MSTKFILSGLAATFALAGIAVAQAPASSDNSRDDRRHPRYERMSPEDMQSMTDARFAGAKAALKLTPEQEKLWGPVEKSARAIAEQRLADMAKRDMKERRDRPDFMNSLEMMAERSAKSAENIKALTVAMAPLWATLDDRQKRLLPRLIRPSRGAMMREGHKHQGEHGQRRQGWHNDDQQPRGKREQ